MKIKDFQSSLDITTKELNEELSEITIEGLATVEIPDRDEEVVVTSGIDLTSYKTNPIILFQHNRNEPVGKGIETEITNNTLKVKAVIYKAINPKVFEAVNAGVLKTFSIGFRGKEGFYNSETDMFYYTKVELYEISLVSVPANSMATFSVVKSADEECLGFACTLTDECRKELKLDDKQEETLKEKDLKEDLKKKELEEETDDDVLEVGEVSYKELMLKTLDEVATEEELNDIMKFYQEFEKQLNTKINKFLQGDK